jgi:hypothetical protein
MSSIKKIAIGSNELDLSEYATQVDLSLKADTSAIPTVNDATLTIQKNGTTVQTFTANQSTAATANITVPTKTSDITNDSDYTTKTYVDSNFVGNAAVQNLWWTRTAATTANLTTTQPTVAAANTLVSTTSQTAFDYNTPQIVLTRTLAQSITINPTSEMVTNLRMMFNRSTNTEFATRILGPTGTIISAAQTFGAISYTANTTSVATLHSNFTNLTTPLTLTTGQNITIQIFIRSTSSTSLTTTFYAGVAVSSVNNYCWNQWGLTSSPDNPVVNDGITTFQLNGTTVGTTSANQSTAKTINYALTKSDVGLANVDNTSDLNKPISTATQTALNSKADTASLATVATSGSYNDLSNKPTLPTASATTLGGVKVGTNLSITDGVLSADAQSVTVDSALSTTSTNPVQNKVITSALGSGRNYVFGDRVFEAAYVGVNDFTNGAIYAVTLPTGVSLTDGLTINVRFTFGSTAPTSIETEISANGSTAYGIQVLTRSQSMGTNWSYGYFNTLQCANTGNVFQFTYNATVLAWVCGDSFNKINTAELADGSVTADKVDLTTFNSGHTWKLVGYITTTSKLSSIVVDMGAQYNFIKVCAAGEIESNSWIDFRAQVTSGTYLLYDRNFINMDETSITGSYATNGFPFAVMPPYAYDGFSMDASTYTAKTTMWRKWSFSGGSGQRTFIGSSRQRNNDAPRYIEMVTGSVFSIGAHIEVWAHN